uniref:Prolyl 4-hydroxylase alpha-subunit N-terminal domain-containing protein n=1 Tax=Phlebotomus papatasi TaxID=29031 RepID=A0A1B0D7K9_PHLPP
MMVSQFTKSLRGTIIVFLVLLINVARPEVFTALVEMEELLETEAVLITNLEEYIRAQEEKLQFLKNRFVVLTLDLNGAAVALMRLQDTYKLDTASVARGELNGIQYATEMSVGDCFELGRQSYINGDFYHTVLWMREAMDRLLRSENGTTTTKADILEYLAFSTYKQ